MNSFGDSTRDSVTTQLTGTSTVRIERGPVSRFAQAITCDDPIFQRADVATTRGLPAIPVPPTYTFSALSFWGTFPDDQLPDSGFDDAAVEAVRALVAAGGVVLHAAEDVEFRRPVTVGDELRRDGAIIDRYQKPGRTGTMTFLVIRNEHRDRAGELVFTATTTLVHRP